MDGWLTWVIVVGAIVFALIIWREVKMFHFLKSDDNWDERRRLRVQSAWARINDLQDRHLAGEQMKAREVIAFHTHLDRLLESQRNDEPPSGSNTESQLYRDTIRFLELHKTMLEDSIQGQETSRAVFAELDAVTARIKSSQTEITHPMFRR